MKQILKYSIIATLLNFILITNVYSLNTIILSQQTTKDKIENDKKLYKNFITSNEYLKDIKESEILKISTEKIYSNFLLKVDLTSNPKVLAGIFLESKSIFPNAFILQENEPKNFNAPKREYIKKDEQQLLWFAIFGLALVGILSLYSSSIQIRNILIRHKEMKDKQTKIEGFLTNIGENIYSLSKKNIGYKGGAEEGKVEKSPAKVMIEKKLFDTTRVMIHFLRIKSKSIKIIEEQFNLNNVLNGVLGLLSHRFEGSNIELIFDVENNVPKNINGDPLHLSEVLTELLQNAITYTTQGEVRLHISIETSFGNKDKLKFEVIDTGIGINNSELEMLFIPSYESDGEYKGLGLFVAKELTHLMGGELHISKSDAEGTTFVCTIPFIKSSNEEKLIYILPKDISTQKKVLIYDHNENSAGAIKKMFAYFKIEAEIISPQKFNSENINLSIYDIILLDIHRLEKNQITNIRDIRKHKSLKIVHITSVFSTKRVISHDYVDDWLEKPISQERIYELILTLFDKKTQEEAKKHLSKKLKVVNPDTLIEMDNISTNNFIHFKGRNILIVEDNIIDQKVMYSILSKAGINITIANHGEEALEYLDDDDNQYDLILMDISMPVMDGYEAITKIRNQTKFDNTPIIALTSLALDNDINKIFRVGSNGYLRKPLKIGFLYAILREFLVEDSNKSILKKVIPKKKVYEGIDGLDTQKGISHSNGSEELYREVLDEFLSAYSDSANSLKAWVNEKRYEHIKRLCLDMKGLTGTIGAYKMFELVDTMHKQFLYNNVHLIPKFVESYEEELERLIITINQYMDEE